MISSIQLTSGKCIAVPILWTTSLIVSIFGRSESQTNPMLTSGQFSSVFLNCTRLPQDFLRKNIKMSNYFQTNNRTDRSFNKICLNLFQLQAEIFIFDLGTIFEFNTYWTIANITNSSCVPK